MSKILFLVNHDVVIYNFRREIVEELIKDGHEVHISSPYGERIDALVALGAVFHEIRIERHGMNPKEEIRIIKTYKKLFKSLRPDICLGFTIKPNVYGIIAARKYGIPFIANVTGLGTSIQNGGLKQKVSLLLYRNTLKDAKNIFFQNESDFGFMLENKVVTKEKCEVLPGSGVNLVQHCYEEYPKNENSVVFSTFGRIMKDKGTDELIAAARAIKQKGYNATFRIIGFFDDDFYKETVLNAVAEGIVEYIEQQKDVHPLMKESHAIIQPSHHEGMSNVLLEAAATGRPVIASDIPGCREAFKDGVSGFGFEVENVNALVEKIVQFLELPNCEKEQMGKAGRDLMEQYFDRNIVVNKYKEKIEGAN